MRIALITDGISPYVIGGMQRHSFYLAKWFAKNKVYVDLYHFNQSSLNIQELKCFDEDEKKYIHSFVIPFPKEGRLPGHYIYESYIYSKRIFEMYHEDRASITNGDIAKYLSTIYETDVTGKLHKDNKMPYLDLQDGYATLVSIQTYDKDDVTKHDDDKSLNGTIIIVYKYFYTPPTLSIEVK